MLQELRIKNYILINDLTIKFSNGFNVITGETGTGKSIILGALNLVTGSRADTSVLTNKESKCVIEASFLIEEYDLVDFFKNNDLDYEPVTILRREILSSGKSRAFINDTPVNLNVLNELGTQLIDIHSQNQTSQLANQQYKMNLIDAFAKTKSIVSEYRKLFERYQSIKKKLEDLIEIQAQEEKDHDYNQFQLNEIEKLDLDEEVDKELDEEFRFLENAGNIKFNIQQIIHELSGSENAMLSVLTGVRSSLSSIYNFHKKLEELYERLSQAEIELKDIASELEDFESTIAVDEERLQEVSDRLHSINKLLHKHQKSEISELIILYNELREKLLRSENMEDEIIALKKEVREYETKVHEMAITLSDQRRSKLKDLSENMTQLLKSLGMEDAKFEAKVEDLQRLNNNGKDRVELYFSANKGIPLANVDKAASGGELSRLVLSIKYLLADSVFLPSLVFDEIDQGISGEIARKVGFMLKKMTDKHQVLLISHQPHVASMGTKHFKVFKEKVNGKTISNIKLLDKKERIFEIAEMLGGANPSSIAIKNAEELLSSSKS